MQHDIQELIVKSQQSCINSWLVMRDQNMNEDIKTWKG